MFIKPGDGEDELRPVYKICVKEGRQKSTYGVIPHTTPLFLCVCFFFKFKNGKTNFAIRIVVTLQQGTRDWS